MREYLFWGKMLANGEWAYGNLCVKPGGENAIITPDDTPIEGREEGGTIGGLLG